MTVSKYKSQQSYIKLPSSNHKVNLLNNPDSYSHNPTESVYAPTIFSNSIVTVSTNAQRPMTTKSSHPTEQPSKPHTWPYLTCPTCPPSTPGEHSSLHNSALISISQFCDDNFEARFTKQNIQILKDDIVILQD